MERAREFLDRAPNWSSMRETRMPRSSYASSAAALAVLAGIAASDAACCRMLFRSGPAPRIIVMQSVSWPEITPGGKGAADDLRELLNLKDKAQYGFLAMSVPEVRKVMRRAGRLVEFAAGVLSS